MSGETERRKKVTHARVAEPEDREYECNYCGVTSNDDNLLYRSRGRACPFCGEGVIQEI